MLELRHVTKIYKTSTGPNVVLRDLSLTLPARESIGILGKNGAGKSTLLRVIGGAEEPTAGEVIRQGRVSWPIGFAGGFNGTLSGEENCRFVARIYGQDVDWVVEQTRAFAEIGRYFYEPVRYYSSGMRARVAFGLSMAIDFDLYLIDEVTAVGDKAFRRKCRNAFAARRERAGLIMVSHDMATLAEYCQRCILLDGGVATIHESVAAAAAAYEAQVAA
ncbi:MAG: ABC transporter ATP-binding protein [Kofleriaceae bacterium]